VRALRVPWQWALRLPQRQWALRVLSLRTGNRVHGGQLPRTSCVTEIVESEVAVSQSQTHGRRCRNERFDHARIGPNEKLREQGVRWRKFERRPGRTSGNSRRARASGGRNRHEDGQCVEHQGRQRFGHEVGRGFGHGGARPFGFGGLLCGRSERGSCDRRAIMSDEFPLRTVLLRALYSERYDRQQPHGRDDARDWPSEARPVGELFRRRRWLRCVEIERSERYPARFFGIVAPEKVVLVEGGQ